MGCLRPAPVDTLVQRAGRCARWFREQPINGQFVVLVGPNEETRKKLSVPYRFKLVEAARKSLPSGGLTWQIERDWVDRAWGGDAKKAAERVEHALREIDFALNLFDRAAQQHRPGEIANVFREIISVEVAVEESQSPRDLQALVDQGQRPETSTSSPSSRGSPSPQTSTGACRSSRPGAISSPSTVRRCCSWRSGGGRPRRCEAWYVQIAP